MRKLAVTVTLAAVVLGCSVALGAGTLQGAYTTKIHSSANGGSLNGTWTLDFAGGHYTVTVGHSLVIRGTYTIHGARITLADGSGPAACPAKGPATYTYKLTGNKLTFKKDSGPKQCVGRDTVLSHPFTKKG